MSIKPVWNEKYLKAGKLAHPNYFVQWKQGLAHVIYGVKRQFPVLLLLISLILFNEFYLNSFFSDELNFSLFFTIAEALLEIAIVHGLIYPIILSAWAELKGKDISDLNYSKWKLPFKIIAVSMLYIILGLSLCLLLLIPGICFFVFFSFTIIILAIDGTGFVESFLRSIHMVKGNFFSVFLYLGLWPFLISMVITFITTGPLFVLAETDILYKLISFGGSLAINAIELTFIPPMVYMFAYLTDRKLHGLN